MQQRKPTAYAAYWDNDIRIKSSSGGVFSVVAEHILSIGGVIYGVAMTTDCLGAKFIRVSDSEELFKLRGSKYLQAKLGDAFNSVKHDLESAMTVLFVGTGCQVNGLKSFLKKDYDKLICVDVICHGSPSPRIWKKYVGEKKEELGENNINVDFRCKEKGWENYGMMLAAENGSSQFIPMKDNIYMKVFLKDYPLRPSCYECTAKNVKLSDITLADFWGINHVAPEMNDGKGTSLVLVRTQKGEKLFGSVEKKLKVKRVTYEEGVRSNPSEYKSVDRPKAREAFFKDVNSMTMNELAKKYCRDSISIRLKRVVKSILFRIPFVKKCLGR